MQQKSWKREVQPCTDVYRNMETGQYKVQPYTEGPVATTAFGEATLVEAEDFEEKIADAVMVNLEKFGKEKFDARCAIRRNPREQAQFVGQHLGVTVEKSGAGGVIIRPLHRERGGFVGLDEGTIHLAEEMLSRKLAEAIAEAFRRAT